MEVINKLDYPNFVVGGYRPNEIIEMVTKKKEMPSGQYSFVTNIDNDIYLIRDPIGINKLFYSILENKIICSNRFDYFFEYGIKVAEIFSCPPGYALNISKKIKIGNEITDYKNGNSFNIIRHQFQVEKKLYNYFQELSSLFKETPVIVCLSGGLDSTIILSLAKKYFKNLRSACFSFLSEEDMTKWLDGNNKLDSLSDDFLTASEISKKTGIEMLPVFRTQHSVLQSVKSVLRLCQDWRDFNVHCGVVNLFLAETIRTCFPNGEVIILTGDLMNEFVCDYKEEKMGNKIYYPQPRIPIGKRRRFFIKGLDSGDRELGIFNAFGLKVFQPYSSVISEFLNVPEKFLEKRDAKFLLNSFLLPKKIISKVSRVKQRAQVGGKDGGTLAQFDNFKIDQNKLLEIWKNIIPMNLSGNSPQDIIQFGSYKSDSKVIKG